MIFRKKRLKTCHFPVIHLSLSCYCLRQKLWFNVTTKIYMEDRIRDPTRISSVALANEPRSCKEETKRQLSPVRCTARREIVAKRICCPEACRVLVDHSTEPVPLPIPERYIYIRGVRMARLTYGRLSARASSLNRDPWRACYRRG